MRFFSPRSPEDEPAPGLPGFVAVRGVWLAGGQSGQKLRVGDGLGGGDAHGGQGGGGLPRGEGAE